MIRNNKLIKMGVSCCGTPVLIYAQDGHSEDIPGIAYRRG